MENNCSNCNEIISQNFCPNCGQKKYKRIDRKYLWEEIQYTVLHTNKGFLYSVKNILKNPGKTAKEFIDGNRVKHYKPILLAFVLSSISAFISYKILGLNDIMKEYLSSQNMDSSFLNDMMSFLSSYMSLFSLFLLPLFALTTKLTFKKWGQNYYEHVVMNAYILSYYTLLNIIFIYPIIFILKNNYQTVIMTVYNLSMLFIPFILIWFYRGFYKDRPLKNIIWRVVSLLLLLIAGYVGIIFIGMVIGFVIVIIQGPQALEYLKPQ